MKTKICSRCYRIKSINKFYKNKIRKDGYSNYCRHCRKEYDAKWYNDNKEKSLKYSKKYQCKNKAKIKKQRKEYLQNQFKKGMTWKNYGKGKRKWCVDHIKPCCSFDLSKPEEQKKCFHYTNLQPLWAKENRQKGVKL